MLKEKGQEVAAKDFDLSEKHLAWFATQPITENIDPAQAGEGLYMLCDAPNAVYDTDGKWESVNWDCIQTVKEELLQGRAVSAGFKADVSAPGQGIPEKSYMDYDNWAHYTYEEVPQSHAICVVGWE